MPIPSNKFRFVALPTISLDLIILLWTMWASVTLTVSGQFLQGETARCTNEGSSVTIPQITSPCIKCRCENQQITCTKRSCPYSSQSCYFPLSLSSGEEDCCNDCKGCAFQDQTYRNGQTWTSPADPCVTYHCGDGIVTKTAKTVCYTPCSDPVMVNGSCCPVCPGCYSNGKLFKEGALVPAPDPCVHCSCRGGNLFCDKTACPVLACPVNLYINEPGSCCPTCYGSRKIVNIENRCIIGSKTLKPGQQLTVDGCTTCTCMKSTLVCKRQVCPVLSCPADFQERLSGACCPRCLPNAPVYCETEEATYNNGDSWRADVCATCKCEDGHVKCSVQKCPVKTVCKDGEELYRDKEDCCLKCVPKTAVCTVYGDPHYTTFDGKSFSFQGRCKYIAVEECSKKPKRFEVQLRNDARKSAHFTWTKSVAVHINQTKIILLQKLRVRVNRKEVRLPHVRLGNFSILSNGYSLTVRTIDGLKVTWDGDSYVEITLPLQYRNQVCGLCGNYNGNASDDMVLRDSHTPTTDVSEFAQSWLVNRKTEEDRCHVADSDYLSSQAARPRNARNVPCPGHPTKKGLRVLRDCRIFKGGSMRLCRRLVDPEPYYKSCLEDLCDCPRNRSCLCQSLLAFLRECERRGGQVHSLKHTHCKTL